MEGTGRGEGKGVVNILDVDELMMTTYLNILVTTVGKGKQKAQNTRG